MRKGHFFKKKALKISPPTPPPPFQISIPFVSVLHRNKALGSSVR